MFDHGQVDLILDGKADAVAERVEAIVAQVASNLTSGNSTKPFNTTGFKEVVASEKEKTAAFNYTRARQIDRPQTQDVIANVFDSYVELSGDGSLGRDSCIRGGIATFMGKSCVVLGTYKGHSPKTMEDANYGMASPHGYRTGEGCCCCSVSA